MKLALSVSTPVVYAERMEAWQSECRERLVAQGVRTYERQHKKARFAETVEDMMQGTDCAARKLRPTIPN